MSVSEYNIFYYVSSDTSSTLHSSITWLVLTEIWMLFCFLGSLNVTFVRDAGTPTAGQSWNLTCTALLNGTIGSPTIEWLSPNSNSISNSSNFTVENMIMVNNSAYERTLVFSSVHTSHGGQYTCRAVLGKASAVNSTELSVKSTYV